MKYPVCLVDPGGVHRRQRGRDIQLQMPLTLEEIATGVNKTISVDIGTGQNELLTVDIPRELKTDTKLDIEEEDKQDQ